MLTPEPRPRTRDRHSAQRSSPRSPRSDRKAVANEPAAAFTPARPPADADARLPDFAALAAPTTGAVVDRAQPHANRADAVLATLPAAEFSELKVEQTLQLLRSDELLRRFDDLKHQMQDLGEEQRRVMASSIAITSGLSIGYVVWLVRGGVLVSSMLSALPAWQMIDPMPVLAAAGAVKRRLRGGAGAAEGRWRARCRGAVRRAGSPRPGRRTPPASGPARQPRKQYTMKFPIRCGACRAASTWRSGWPR